MTEEIVQPAPAEAPKPQQSPFDFDKEFEEQKKKDVETFKSYGLVTKEDVEKQFAQYKEQTTAEVAALRAEFAAFKEWALRKKAQGLNGGGTEKAPDNLAHWKPSW